MSISIKKVFVAMFFALLFIFSFTVKASADQWYYPSFIGHPVTNTVECKVGYLYGPNNLKNGNCRVRYDNVVENIINNAVVGAVSGGVTAIGVHNGTYHP
ncbi:hypothetical protein [Streptococcus suis]